MIMFKILEKYNILKITDSVEKHGSGPFNRTYFASTHTDNDYIIQLYENDNIYRNKDFTHNSERVIREISDRNNVEMVVVDGKNYAIVDNYFVRCYKIKKGCVLFDSVLNRKMAYEMGKALGNFYHRTKDIPIEEIKLTNDNYHNVEKRHYDFDMYVSNDIDMYLTVFNQTKFIDDRKDYLNTIYKLLKENKVPPRVIHNNVRKTNFIFDYETYECVDLIGFTASIKGSLLHDYGNGVRYFTSTASESDNFFDKVTFNIDYISQFTNGFLGEVKDIITEVECEYLVDSIKVMALDVAIKYLTNHVKGDVQLGIEYKTQNLDKCKNQLKLVEEYEKNYFKIKDVIEKEVSDMVKR